MRFKIGPSESSDDGSEETENVRNEETEGEPEVKSKRKHGRNSEVIAVVNYQKTKAYIITDIGKGMDVKIVREPDKTADILNAYADLVEARTENELCRKEGDFGKVGEVVDGILVEQTSRDALSKMVELFTLIVDLHAACGVELWEGKTNVGLTECLRFMTGE